MQNPNLPPSGEPHEHDTFLQEGVVLLLQDTERVKQAHADKPADVQAIHVSRYLQEILNTEDDRVPAAQKVALFVLAGFEQKRYIHNTVRQETEALYGLLASKESARVEDEIARSPQHAPQIFESWHANVDSKRDQVVKRGHNALFDERELQVSVAQVMEHHDIGVARDPAVHYASRGLPLLAERLMRTDSIEAETQLVADATKTEYEPMATDLPLGSLLIQADAYARDLQNVRSQPPHVMQQTIRRVREAAAIDVKAMSGEQHGA